MIDLSLHPVLAYGADARDSVLEAVLDVPAMAVPALAHDAVPASGILGVMPSADEIRIEQETLPDALSGDGSGADQTLTPLCLGKKLDLQLAKDLLFHSDADGNPVINADEHLMLRQGNLKNCPLVACLVAMARSPGYRRALLAMVRRVALPITTVRRPAPYEWCFEEDKPALLIISTGYRYVVTFRRRLVATASIARPNWLGHVVRGVEVIVAPPLYHDTRETPPILHYARLEDGLGVSKGQPLWPAIIEKAYAIAKGNNSYEGLNNFVSREHWEHHHEDPSFDLPQGLDPLDVLEDIAGPSTAAALAGLNDAQLAARLGLFETRPIVLDTRDDLPDGGLPPPDHAVAVVGVANDDAGVLQVTVFDAANNAQIMFPMDQLRNTFANIFQVNLARSG